MGGGGGGAEVRVESQSTREWDYLKTYSCPLFPRSWPFSIHINKKEDLIINIIFLFCDFVDIQVFFSNVSQCQGVDSALAKKVLQFRDSLTKKYHWDFTSEPEEDAPTIVNLVN